MLADDPALTARGDGGELMAQQPVPVVLGERTVPETAAVLRHPQRPMLLRTHDLAAALRELQRAGIRTLYVEAGPTLATAFVAARLVDRFEVYLAPTLIGGPRTALADIGVSTIAGQRRRAVASVEQLGDDLLVTAHPVRD